MGVGAFGAAGPRVRKHVTQAPRPETGDVTTLTPCMEGPSVAVLHGNRGTVTQTVVQVMASGAGHFQQFVCIRMGTNFAPVLTDLFVYSH
jgi:hypothetical protein